MKPTRISMMVYGLAVMVLAGTVWAGTVVKDDNTTDLNLAGSWVSGGPPESGDIGKWDSTVTAANTVLLGGDMAWDGVEVVDPGGTVTINAGNTLTLGASGIDMSASTVYLYLQCGIDLGAAQQWHVSNNERIYLEGGGDLGHNTLTFVGPGSMYIRDNSVTAVDSPLVNMSDFVVNSGFVGLEEGSGTLSPTNLIIRPTGTFRFGGKAGGMAVVESTVVTGGVLQSTSRSIFSTPTMTISQGGELNIINVGGSSTSITITDGLTIKQPAAGGIAPINWQYVNSHNRRAVMHLNGDLTFVGDGGNVNSATVTVNAATGTYGDGYWTWSGQRIFDIGDGGADTDLIVQPRFIGSGTLVKSGPGTMEIQGVGTNLYSGGTIVSNGTLLASGVDGSVTGSGTVTVENGGVLGGTGTVGGAASVANGGGLAPGASAGTLTFGNNLTLNDSSALTFELGAAWQYDGGNLPSSSDLVIVEGDLVLDGQLTVEELPSIEFGTHTLFIYEGSLTDNTLELSGLPESTQGSIVIDAGNGAVNLVYGAGNPPGTIVIVR